MSHDLLLVLGNFVVKRFCRRTSKGLLSLCLSRYNSLLIGKCKSTNNFANECVAANVRWAYKTFM